MSLVAPVKDGKVQNTSSASSLANKTQEAKGNNADKDTFLQMLVAEMKYQDPLQPWSRCRIWQNPQRRPEPMIW